MGFPGSQFIDVLIVEQISVGEYTKIIFQYIWIITIAMNKNANYNILIKAILLKNRILWMKF